MNPEPGLRERKKERTRETIARAAHALFAERGYHATTLNDIAQAADVSTRTIFAYFPSKEDILFSDFPLMRRTLARALADRPAGEDTLETVRKFILASRKFETSDLDEQLHFCITNDDTLRSHMRARIAQLEELIAPAIAEDLAAPANDPRPQIVAASLTAAFDALSDHSGSSDGKPTSPEEFAARINPVITFLRGGLEALKDPHT
jgi:AcrR family transcriptional regulator